MSTTTTSPAQSSRPPKPKKKNPISAAIKEWVDSLPESAVKWYGREPLRIELVDSGPKRWVVYHPLVLLPTGSFENTTWRSMLSLTDQLQQVSLWSGILREILAASGCDIPPTHLAVNEGIPARITQAEGDGAAIASPEDVDDGAFQETDDGAFQETNVVRRPGLRLLYGDFGPGPTRTLIENPTEKDFEEAFWVKTRQNGIWQVWAPLYTMFSRGNVKEKARLLDFHKGRDDDGRFDERRVRDGWAVDLYAGIGYFSFSYARLGMRVLCWEINPWSTHALYRGAKLNGWRAMVFDGTVSDDDLPVTVIEKGVFDPSRPQIVIFPEDNTRARRRINQLREFAEADPEKYSSLDIVHVNCGLLPSSSAIWRDTLDMVSSRGGWLHLHENVGVADIETRAREIRGIFDGWLADEGKGRKADVEHVERVKTFAPGVWHCVFDVYVTGPESTSTVT